MRILFCLILAAIVAAGEPTTIHGTIAWFVPHGSRTSLGRGSGVEITVMHQGVLVDQAVIAPATVRWDDTLHGFQIEVPPTPLQEPAGAVVGVHWWIEATWNGRGPWLEGGVAQASLSRSPRGFSLGRVRATLSTADIRPERPLGLTPVAVRPTVTTIALESGPVTCQVLRAPAAKGPASAARPGLIIAVGMGPGDADACRTGLSLWWSGAARAGWTVAAPQVRGDRLWFDAAVGDAPVLIDRLVASLGCDPRRVVVAGASNGGTTALTWIRNHPDRLAAAVAFPGCLDGPAAAVAGKPILLRWGALDDASWRSSASDTAKRLVAAGAVVDQAEMPLAEHLVPVTGPQLLRWLASAVPPAR